MALSDCVRRPFNRHGFDAVSIDGIMGRSGPDAGAFYTYFASKSDLYAEVQTCFFNTPGAMRNWDGVRVDLQAHDAGAPIIRAYLSRQHAEAIETAGPMRALPSDVARSGEACVRARVQSDGRSPRARVAQRPTDGSHGSAQHRGTLHRRDGHRAGDQRSRARGRNEGSLRGRRARPRAAKW